MVYKQIIFLLFFQITPDDENDFLEMHSEHLNKKLKKLKSVNFSWVEELVPTN